jgi:hypothetical protein
VGLLSPWFLAGMAAIGLPVYLHLLRQHRNTPVPFSSLMFFEKRTQSSIKHRRLKHLLLLLLRIILLALLVAAFAQPFINRFIHSTDSRQLLVVVDESFSMRAGSRLADARREAAALLAARKATTTARVAAFGSQLRLLTGETEDPSQLRAAVESIKPTDTLSNYGEFTRAIRSMALSTRQPLEVHFFSDMQKSALPPGFTDLALPDTVKLVLHPVVTKPEPNWAVQTVTAPAVIWDPKRARVQATIAAFDAKAARKSVSLVVNGKSVASKAVDIGDNGRATVEFQGLDIPYGFSKCEVRVDGGDTMPPDDRALFAVQRSDPRRVLFVHETRDTRSPLYVQAALAAATEAAFQIEPVASEQTANLDPSRFAFVILSDVISIPGQFQDSLNKYVRSGGSVWIAAGPSSARHTRLPVLDEPVVEGRYFSRGGERFSVLGEADPAHASIRKATRWEGVKFYYAVKIQPGPQTKVVARLSDQTPILVEKKIGEGRVLLFASALDNVSNDFPLLPIFVPFVEQTARYLAGIEERLSNAQVGSFIELRTAKEQSVSVEIVDPDGGRPLTLDESVKLPSYQVTREGFYEVRRANGRHEMIAINADRKESDLSVIPAETIQLWSAAGGSAPAGGNAAQEEREQKKPWSLWWYIMIGVLIAAAAESFLASRYLGVQREDNA